MVVLRFLVERLRAAFFRPSVVDDLELVSSELEPYFPHSFGVTVIGTPGGRLPAVRGTRGWLCRRLRPDGAGLT
jgi:hypothetical protein